MTNFWQFFWLLVWWFVFFAYLILLFNIIGDLFRDRDMGGVAKALWIVFLIVFPYLGALAYVIARGRGMADRQQARVARAQFEAESFVRTAAAKSPAEQIADAKALLDAGVLTEDEFKGLKAKALA